MGAIKAIGYNLANLLNFTGRATRAQFWPYAASAVLLSFVGMSAIVLPEGTELMRRYAAEYPEQTTVLQGPVAYSVTIHGDRPELMPDGMMAMISIGAVVIIFLLAAAVARRLHDRGMSGAWGLMPIPFLAFAFIMMLRLFAQFGQGAPDMGTFFVLFFNNLLYVASLVLLIVLLCGASTKGENRYGPVGR